MMTRQQRAKQFMPFDAMKGLKEALRDREERHCRVDRHEISDEQREENSEVLYHIVKGNCVALDYYHAFHDVSKKGIVTEINITFQFLKVGNEKIQFEDIYHIVITDAPSGRAV